MTTVMTTGVALTLRAGTRHADAVRLAHWLVDELPLANGDWALYEAPRPQLEFMLIGGEGEALRAVREAVADCPYPFYESVEVL